MSPPVTWGVALGVALGAVGWALLVSSLPHSAWGVGGGQVTVVASVTNTRGLWSDCVTDASGVTSCVPLQSLLTLPALGAAVPPCGLGSLSLRSSSTPNIRASGMSPARGCSWPGGGDAFGAGGGSAPPCRARTPPEHNDPQSPPGGPPPAPRSVCCQFGGQIRPQRLRVTPPSPPPKKRGTPPSGLWGRPHRKIGDPSLRILGHQRTPPGTLEYPPPAPPSGLCDPPPKKGDPTPLRTVGTLWDRGDPPRKIGDPPLRSMGTPKDPPGTLEDPPPPQIEGDPPGLWAPPQKKGDPPPKKETEDPKG
eukprot:XP_025002317.1 basic salivary proline-rich protein 2-like isoform X2 [Gallus gallus]